MNFPGKPLSIREAISHKDLKLRGKADKSLKEYAAFLDLLETKYLELSPAELDYTVLTNGPGSFTGLRLAISAVKSINLAYIK